MTEIDDALAPLVRHARAHGLRSAAESRGACLDASASLARHARELGLACRVRFARWRVTGDRSFLEHWALVVTDAAGRPGPVIDMTAVQVDGDAEPVRAMHGYPEGYLAACLYPIDVVLPVLDHAPLSSDGAYRRLTVWRLHARLGRHDLRRAWQRRSLRAAAGALRRLGEASLLLPAGWLLERAQRRLNELKRQLH